VITRLSRKDRREGIHIVGTADGEKVADEEGSYRKKRRYVDRTVPILS